jgi:hypothetical protein
MVHVFLHLLHHALVLLLNERGPFSTALHRIF